MKLRLPWRRKNAPAKITGVGQTFEFEGVLMMVTMIEWRADRGHEITLKDERNYRV